ncbi:MAG: phospholipase D-like domain-containing protein [Chloroflexota bacterium]
MTQQAPSQNRQRALLLLIIVLVGTGIYMATGVDVLGIYTNEPQQEDISDSGEWWEVHFTLPQKRDSYEDLSDTVAAKLIEKINQAQQSIYIASFEFNLTPVAEALIAAKNRGVDIRWVTDDEHGLEADEEDGHGQFEMLEDAGIHVKDDARSALMHNKFWIFDQQTVWTGSTNITTNGVFRNNNNVIVLHSPRIAAMYQLEFDEMWQGEFGPRSPSTFEQQQTNVNGTAVQIVFAAEDEAMQILTPLIDSTQQTIHFMAFAFTHDDLGNAMLSRAQAGVEVQGIFETRGSETEFSEMAKLYCADVPVRQDGNPRTFHHKVIVIDGQLVITGSLNFSNNADDSNDENIILIRNAEIASLYLQEFNHRWNEAEAPDPEDLTCP